MATFAKNRISDARVDADEPHGYGLGAAGGASITLHIGVAAGLAWLTWATLREPVMEREPEVFRVVPASVSPAWAGVAADAAEAAASQAQDAERLFVAPPSVRSWTPPPSHPSQAEERSETRVPAQTEPARDASRTISYEEYQRRQGASSTSGRPSRANTSALAATEGVGARINVGQIKSDLGVGAVSPTSTSDGATETAMQAYFGELIGRLRDSQKLPAGLDGLLKAEVKFTLAANGAVSDVGVLRSSGSKAFDQSVVEAFGRLKMRARPDGKTEVHRLTFRTVE